MVGDFRVHRGVLVGIRFAYWNTEGQLRFFAIAGAGFFGLVVIGFALFSYSGWYLAGLVVAFMAGIFGTMYPVAVQSSIQLMVPDGIRGRALSIYFLTSSLQPLGGAVAGVFAKYLGAPMAVAFGGLAISSFIGGALVVNRRVRALAFVRTPVA